MFTTPSRFNTRLFRIQQLLLLCSAACATGLYAADGTWDGGGADANWTTLGNWSGDAEFPGATTGETNTDTATFDSAIANTWGESGTPILIDSATFNIRGITFGTTAVGDYTIGTTGGNALYLTSGGTIQILANAADTNTQTISAPLIVVGENATYTFNNGRDKNTSIMILNGSISAGSTGAADLNFYGRQGSAPNEANGIISDGAADSVSLNHQTGTWYYSANNTYTGDTTVNAGAARFTGDNSGGGNFTINSGAGAYFTGTNSYTGSFSLISGVSNAQLFLGASDSTTGSILGVTDISVSGGRFYIDNTAGNADRLNDNATITLYGTNAIFELRGNSSVDTTETVGGIIIGPGTSSINLTNLNGRITTLNASSLSRESGNGTLLISSRTLGLGSSLSGRFFLTEAPSGNDFVGTGGSPSTINSGTTNLAIIPWLYGSDSGTGRFITHDSINGLRYLSSNETAATIAGAATPAPGETGDNVLLTTSETGITSKTINSLMLSPGALQAVTGAGAGNSLVISSGALANSAAALATLSGFDSITFGNGEGVITTAHPSGIIQIDSAIDVTGGGGLTKTGSGRLILNAENLYTGNTVVNQGALQIGNGGTSGNIGTGNLVLNPGTTLNYNRTDALAIGSVSGGGDISLDQATATLTANQTGTGNVINSISGQAGSTFIFGGSGETTVSNRLTTEDQLIKITSGTVNLSNSRQTSANLEITGGVVNALDSQASLRRVTAGTQTFTISGGEFNVFNNFGLKGINNDGGNNNVATVFIGTQTGGTVNIAGQGSDDLYIGNNTAGGDTTYSLSGGRLNYLGTRGISLRAHSTGGSSTTFNLSGGTLLANNGISGTNGNGAKQAFVWTGGVLATRSYDATNLTSTAGAAVVTNTTNTLTNAGGTLAPGDIGTTGRTDISGNYAVTSADAALHIDIGGSTASGAFQDAPGAGKHDQVNFISNNRIVDLAGKLYVNLIDDFDGNGSFVIINNTGSGGQINGTFDNLVADALGSDDRVVLDNGLSSYAVVKNATNVTLNSFIAENVWAGFDGSDWSDAINWTAFSPQAAGHLAKFDASAFDSGDHSINLDASQTIGGIIFDSSDHNYTISSGNGSSITLDNTTVSAGAADSAITVTQGTHTVAVPVTLNNNLNITTTGATSGLTISGVIDGTDQAITKDGTGSLNLTAGNTYTGGTSIVAGSLFANNSTGSATGSGDLNVSAAATLGGNGSIGGATTVFGSIAPGANASSTAVLSFNAGVTLKSGSAITIDINGSNARGVDFDGIDFNSSLSIEGGTLTFNFGSAIADDTVLNIFDGAALTADFTSVGATGLGDYNGTFALSGDNTAYIALFGNQNVALDLATGNLSFYASAAVPEPASFAALLGAATLALGLGRRRRQVNGR